MNVKIIKAEPAHSMMRVEEAAHALAECKRVDEAKSIRDKAQAIQAYLRQQAASREAQNDAAEIKLRAERRLGELLADQEKAKGTRNQFKGRDASGRSIVQPPAEVTPSYADLGIEKTAAKRWQDIAKVPEQKFEAYIAEQRERPDGEITSAGARREAPKAERRTVPNTGGEFQADVAAVMLVNKMSAALREWPEDAPLLPLVLEVRQFLRSLERMEKERSNG